MFSQQKAAEFFVQAWCQDMSLLDVLRVTTETMDKGRWVNEHEAVACHQAFPWMPASLTCYITGRGTRAHVNDNFPKLSEWLWSQPNNEKRMRCEPQVERLTDRKIFKKSNHPPRVDKEYARVMFTASVVRDIQKSTQRSAWNVCKK